MKVFLARAYMSAEFKRPCIEGLSGTRNLGLHVHSQDFWIKGSLDLGATNHGIE